MKKLALVIFVLFTTAISGQTIYQKSSTYKVIGTALDTVILPGTYYSMKTGFITNEDIAFPLYVYFSYSGSTRLDSNSLVLLPAGNSLKFSFDGRSIFRRTNDVGGYKTSQVITGKNVSVSYGIERKLNPTTFVERDFSGQVIRDWDLTGCNFYNCNFTNAKLVNCLIKDCDFVDSYGILDIDLLDGARLLPDGSGYEFRGVQGDSVFKDP